LEPIGSSVQKDVLERLLKRIKSIPPLPQVAAKAMELLVEPDPDLDELLNLIKLDQAMSLRLLSTVNSVFYGLPYQITDIKKATLLLGLDQVRDIVLKIVISESVFRTLMADIGDIHRIIFNHSIATAVLSEHICKLVNFPARLEAFMGGLFHDVSKLLLLIELPEQYVKVQAMVNDITKSTQYRIAENLIFGIDHCILGEMLLAHWKLPHIFRNIALAHHFTYKEIQEKNFDFDPMIIFIVQIANSMAHQILADIPDSFLLADNIAKLSIKLGLNKVQLKNMSHNIRYSLEQISKIVPIGENPAKLYFDALKNTIGYLKNLNELKAAKKFPLPSYIQSALFDKNGIEGVLQRLSLALSSKLPALKFETFVVDEEAQKITFLRQPKSKDFIYSEEELGNFLFGETQSDTKELDDEIRNHLGVIREKRDLDISCYKGRSGVILVAFVGGGTNLFCGIVLEGVYIDAQVLESINPLLDMARNALLLVSKLR